MRLRTLGVTAALLFALTPRPALAQAEFVKDNVTKIIKKVGIHASTSFSDPLNQETTDKDGSYGFSVGLAPGRTDGWRYPVGLAWFTESLRSPSGDNFAKFRSRPVVAGIGYGWHFGKLNTGAQLQAGWAFNSVKPEGDPSAAFLMPGNPIHVNIHNTFVLRPQLKVEYFLTQKFTVRSSLSYIFERPRVDVRSAQGTLISERWNASNVSLSMGIGFYPFRK